MPKKIIDTELEKKAKLIAQLQGSFLLFTQTFFELLNGVPFSIPHPPKRESHFITISKALTRAARLQIPSQRLVINVAPGSGKCLHIDTEIWTSDGLKPLWKIHEGDSVLGWHRSKGWVFRWVRAIDKSERECFEIQFESGRRVICTHEHRWLTSKGYMATSFLKPGAQVKALNGCDTYSDTIEDVTHILKKLHRLFVPDINLHKLCISYQCPTYKDAENVQHLLSYLGYACVIKPYYTKLKVIMTHEAVKDFLSDIKYYYKSTDICDLKELDLIPQYRSVPKQRGYIYDTIVNIEPVGKKPVMDIQVDEIQNFVANGLVSHNSTMLAYWTAWTMSRYPDSKFMYISYSKHVAGRHTATIRDIMSHPYYEDTFNVRVARTQYAKTHFKTLQGGEVMAFGSQGSITGMDAGRPNLDRFSGCLLLDDLHKADEATSDTMRQKVIENYKDTIQSRIRGIKVPQIFIGQRLHERDIGHYFLHGGEVPGDPSTANVGGDGYKWERVIIKSVDEHNESFYPALYPIDRLEKIKNSMPYVFASQHQQNPVPAGGALYKPDDFVILNTEPEIYATFITADTAETDKTYNDATVFSFWGVYEIKERNIGTGQIGLHWLGCSEIWVEPRDLEDEFMIFWHQCATYKVKPTEAFIEKKSTGTTLTSLLKSVRGIKIRAIGRTIKDGSKSERFIKMQQYIAAKLVSFPAGFDHVDKCITHMTKITANNTHARDDIADTVSDAVHVAFEVKRYPLPVVASTIENQYSPYGRGTFV